MENRYFFHRSLHTFHTESLSRCVINKEVDRLLVCRKSASAQELCIIQTFFRAVYRFFMVGDPGSQILQNFFLSFIQRAILLRSYVKKHPSPQSDAVAEHPDDLTAGLVIVVGRTIAPGIVDRRTEFPFPFRSVKRNSLLRRLIIAIPLHAGVQDHMGIQRVKILTELLHMPLACAALPVSVKPQKIHGAIIGHKLTQLIVVEFQELFPFFRIFFTTCR